MDNILNDTIIVFAIHPDDETLGCGGALLHHKESGDSIHWVIGTRMSTEKGFKKDLIEKRENEINEVAKAFQFDGIHRLNLDTTCCDQYSTNELVDKCSEIINKVKPTIIYLPFKGDAHSDHRICFDAMYACTKSFRYPFIKRVLMMETLSETDFSVPVIENVFIPNVFINISAFIDKKCQIMSIYESECRDHPFPRSVETIRSLAKVRGAAAGVNYAESFMLLKDIVK